MLEGKYDITFVCREVNADFEYNLLKNNYKIILINDENEFLELCNDDKIVLIDGHHFPSELYQKVREKGSNIICIDDLHDKNYMADVMINQAPGIIPQDYNNEPFCYYGLGPDYALLRSPFLKAAQHKKQITSISSCFICFGGGDQLDLTLRTAKLAAKYDQLKTINIVTGSAYKHEESLNIFAESDDRIKLFHAIDEDQMAEIMSRSDLAIVPCSTILLEVFAAGCLPVSGYFVENQKYFYNNFLNKNAFLDAGNFSEEQINSALNKALNSEIKIEEIIDGKSKKRIQKCFQLIENLNSINLKLAEESDTNVTYKWASDPVVRKWSFSRNPITFEEHKTWFSNKIKDNSCVYYIASVDDKPVGSIRFDMNNTTATISYLIDPLFHGKGLGQALLIKGCKTFRDTIKKEKHSFDIVGYVTEENLASQKIFENIGFLKNFDGDKLKYSLSISDN